MPVGPHGVRRSVPEPSWPTAAWPVAPERLPRHRRMVPRNGGRRSVGVIRPRLPPSRHLGVSYETVCSATGCIFH